MEFIRFQDKIFLQKGSQWFLWESAWDMFRPICAVAWDGSRFTIDDEIYCKDLFDEYYGFGSPEMYRICEKLTDEFEQKLDEAKPVHNICIGRNPEWFRDSPQVLTVCAPRTIESWKAKANSIGKRRTLKNCSRHTFTKRRW